MDPTASQTSFEAKDSTMADATQEQAASPAPAAPAPAAATKQATTNGAETSSRAASLHPDVALQIPAEARPHGAPVRQYLNTKVTGVLLEGMKKVGKEQPKDPLRVLGEFLLQKSKELEQ